jgi:hypothetical protein
MITQRLIEAVAKRCHNCSSELQTSDNFCRSCGTSRKTGALAPESDESWRDSVTTVLNNEDETKTYQSLSSPLVKSLTQNVAIRTSPLSGNRFAVCVVAVLIAVPIWLLILLLSPLDAYTAIRSVSSQVNCK